MATRWETPMSSDLVALSAAMLGALAVSGLAYAFLAPYFSSDREKDKARQGDRRAQA